MTPVQDCPPSHQSPKHRKESNEPDAFVEIHRSDDFAAQSGDQNLNALSEDSANLKDEGGQAFGSHAESVAHVIVRTVDCVRRKTQRRKYPPESGR